MNLYAVTRAGNYEALGWAGDIVRQIWERFLFVKARSDEAGEFYEVDASEIAALDAGDLDGLKAIFVDCLAGRNRVTMRESVDQVIARHKSYPVTRLDFSDLIKIS